MLSSAFILTSIIVIAALIFDFINGFHDSANAIACSVSTRVLTLEQAVVMAAVLNFIGAFVNEEVAKTIGSGIVNPDHISQTVIVAALVGAIVWNIITWYFGIPSSSSHALIGGLVGSAMVFQWSLGIVNWSNLFWKVIIWIFLSPVIGFIIGFIFMTAINTVLRIIEAKPSSVSKIFSKAQICSGMLIAFNHGCNDSQKSMGIITMALISGRYITQFEIPTWVKICCAVAMALGTSLGGKKIIKTMGSGMAKLAPINGFSAEMSASAVMFTATMLKAPVSTTHIITGSIMGVGASKRFSAVKWVVAKNIVTAWVITIPASASIAALAMFLIKLF